jgi:hypothetical protein
MIETSPPVAASLSATPCVSPVALAAPSPEGAAPAADFSVLLQSAGAPSASPVLDLPPPPKIPAAALAPAMPQTIVLPDAAPSGKSGKPAGKDLPPADAAPSSTKSDSDASASKTPPATPDVAPAPCALQLAAMLSASPVPAQTAVPTSSGSPTATRTNPSSRSAPVLLKVGTNVPVVPVPVPQMDQPAGVAPPTMSTLRSDQARADPGTPAPAVTRHTAEQPTAPTLAAPGQHPPHVTPAATAPQLDTTAPVAMTPQVSAPRHDIAALVDRIAEARAAAGPQVVHAALVHADFGAVSLRFRPEQDHIAVTMGSADPGLAPAVQAAAAASLAGNTAGEDGARDRPHAPTPQHLAQTSTSAGRDPSQQQPAPQQRAARQDAPAPGSRGTAPSAAQDERRPSPTFRRAGIYA